MVKTARGDRLQQACTTLAEVLRAGGQITVARKKIQVDGLSARVQAEVAAVDAELLELLDIPKKEWAQGQREVALAVQTDPMTIDTRQFAAVVLTERRWMGPVLVGGPESRAALKELVGDTPVCLVGAKTYRDRAALGLLCAEAGIGLGRQTFLEVPVGRGEDYRHWLAGSAFLDAPEPTDVLGQAVRVALAARSLRKDVPQAQRQPFYTSAAAKTLARKGEGFEAIRKRIPISSAVLAKWLDTQPPTVPEEDTASVPSAAQIQYVRSILDDLPFLRQILPENWTQDRNHVRQFLNTVAEQVPAWRGRWREMGQAARLRRELGAGQPLEAALKAAAVSREVGIDLLEYNGPVMMRDLERDISNATNQAIVLADPTRSFVPGPTAG